MSSGSSIAGAPNMDPHLRKKDEMYPMTNLAFGATDLQRKYNEIIGPLTLFAPFSHEDIPDDKELELERPVTPIDKSIDSPTIELNELANLVRRRIVADPNIEYLSVEDQEALAAITMGEVNDVWPDVRKQVDDPFLTPSQNRELKRRITVHIVTVCQQLFQHYVAKAQILKKRGVFSGPANMSRLKAQLGLDVNKFLNILAIRRHIVADLRGKRASSDDDSSEDEVKTTVSAAPLSYKKLIEISRPKRKKKGQFKLNREIRDMERQMPYLETHKVYDLLPDLSHFIKDEDEEEDTETVSEKFSEMPPYGKSSSKDSFHLSGKLGEERSEFRLHKCNSLPDLVGYETLAEELSLDEDGRTSVKSSYHPDILTRPFTVDEPEEEEKDEELDVKGRPDTRQKLQQDLMKLSQYRSMREAKEEQLDEEDLPPLLQANSTHGQVEGRKEMLQQQLKELEEKEAREKAEQMIKIRKPTHPQPSTITKKMPNQQVVRTSDIRVSERVSLSSVTLEMNTTVYNELVGDIDPHTLKRLDRNLFFGQEINEVYEEIMKTLPNDHFKHDQDDLIEATADQVNLSVLLPSANLSKHRKDRIMNPTLIRNIAPPWGNENVTEWAKSPLNNADQLSKQRAAVAPTPASGMMSFQNYGATSGGSQYGDAAVGGNIMDAQSSVSMPTGQGMIDDQNSRAYASWLSWWKSTINSDDYMKYLSTQESDYLGVAFHFYDSGEDDSDDEKTGKKGPSTARLEKMKERKQKIDEMKVEKSTYVPGLWNANAVLMGGLGKDPEVLIEEEEEEVEVTPRSVRSRRSKHSHTAASRKSSEGKDMGATLSVKDVDASRIHSSTSKLSSTGGLSGTRVVSRASRLTDATSAKSQRESKLSIPLSPQDRLEAIWSALQMPDNLKLDMAIKYSSDDYINQLPESIEAWEKATEIILQREALIARLESFERLASDPDRFFQKGYRGSSVARLQEAKQRSQLYSALDEIDKRVKKKVNIVKDNFNDTMTFQGRPYIDKLKYDRTEMLYWLQQERRQYAIERASLAQELPLKMAELPSL
uniref:Coiled-coil domain-containing protein 87-like n=1 Tax=Saccoglossus kowalevskii TaxID=10224 RepID=A0ABM0M2F9_SACKO|nr:PREDICTED: coiled-coil domain-containing protein 87-like [Saccoglossus kowalevskii]